MLSWKKIKCCYTYIILSHVPFANQRTTSGLSFVNESLLGMGWLTIIVVQHAVVSYLFIYHLFSGHNIIDFEPC